MKAHQAQKVTVAYAPSIPSRQKLEDQNQVVTTREKIAAVMEVKVPLQMILKIGSVEMVAEAVQVNTKVI